MDCIGSHVRCFVNYKACVQEKKVCLVYLGYENSTKTTQARIRTPAENKQFIVINKYYFRDFLHHDNMKCFTCFMGSYLVKKTQLT